MDEATLHTLLKKGQQYQASDILLKVGQPRPFAFPVICTT
jgi:hypothetical protein